MSTPGASPRAARLRARHHDATPLVLPNVWDAASARAFADAGFEALATSSTAVSAVLGFADGEQTPRAEMFAAVSRIAAAVDVPVTADIEAGYGLAPAELVERLLGTGAVGCNLEDSRPGTHTLVDVEQQAQMLAAVRAAAGEALVLNARIDVFVAAGARDRPTAELIDAAVARGQAYRAAGADCVYPIFAPADALTALAQRIGGPLNAMYRPAGPTIGELARLGATRITFGGGQYARLRGVTADMAQELVADLAELAAGS